MTLRFLLALILLTGLLTSCSLLQIAPLDTRIQSLNAQTHWQVLGKISLRNAQESVTGLMNWQQSGDEFNVVISGPFGQGTTRLKGSETFAELYLPNQEAVYRSDSAEQLMVEMIGWSFPVNHLTYWVKGIPAPAPSEAMAQDELGLITGFKQHGWRIELKRYFRSDDNQWLPGLIKLKGYDQTITLAVNQWISKD